MLFHKENRNASPRTQRIYALFEIVYTIVDFAAAVFFVIGSVMFLSEDWQQTGTWLFIFGSLMFAAKPGLRLMREIKLASLGDTEDLADRFKK
jgi:uncharacterized membrane protein